MTDTSHSAAHLDAEQLAAFAEGMLPEHERLLVLGHIAQCVHCRQIAFLAQEPLPAEVSARQPAPRWRAWAHPWLLGGAGVFAATALLLGTFLLKRPEGAGRQNPKMALNKNQDPPAPPMSPAVGSQRSAHPAGPAVSSRATSQPDHPPYSATQQPLPEFGQPMPQAAVPVLAPSPSTAGASAPVVPSSSTAGNASSLPLGRTTEGNAPPMPSPKASPAPPAVARGQAGATVDAAQIQSLPINGRMTTALRTAKMRAAPPAAGPLHLQVEHGSGAADGKAELSGMVLDASGATIPGATVLLLGPAPDSFAKAVTDGSGHFALAPIPAGQYQAQIAAPGFVTAVQGLDLQSRDVARSETVLTVGAVSEAVEVSAANAEVSTASSSVDTAEIRKSKLTQENDTLPEGHTAVTVVSLGDREMALDTAGSLFARSEGKRWKRVEPQWSEAVKTLQSAIADPTLKYNKKAGRQVFQITTTAGTVWSSTDGKRWIRAN